MARLTISEAARQAGITRQYLHKKYIKTGTLTAFKDELDRPYVESADLLRVFNGRLPGPKLKVAPVDGISPPGILHKATLETTGEVRGLQVEVAVLREQLHAAQEREKEKDRAHQERERWYQGQLESMAGALKLLDHRPNIEPIAVAPLAEIAKVAELEDQVAIERARVQEMEAQLAAERSRGFFSRVFRGKR